MDYGVYNTIVNSHATLFVYSTTFPVIDLRPQFCSRSAG